MDVEVFISSTRNKIIARHAHNIVLTTWIADWLHTLPFEVEVIWPAQWNLVKFLYLFSRYFPIDIIFSYMYIEVPDVEVRPRTLTLTQPTASDFEDIPFVDMSDLILRGPYYITRNVRRHAAVIFIRLYALSRQSKFFRWWLIVQFFAVQVTIFALIGPFLASFRWAPSPVPQYVACVPVAANPLYAAISFALLMANETLITLVMLYIGFMKHRHTRSPLVKIFYRDGFVFFLFLTASSVVNIAMLASLPPANRTLFAIPQRVIHSMLASRMILHLRQESYTQEHGHSFDERTKAIHEWTQYLIL
ncbi:hypothetical protein EST38_g9951 [Candolleomyces aberdarensis]|uniref:DUF6533 domain-containing protein n=1 Tax=Candolleomyces aberdarensis TaxID=2316362 RepID=A0A4V1Q2Q4_9AGAR|nr:hypothetical protein EST38_g9951 [Candolleomyces aberdarensis]